MPYSDITENILKQMRTAGEPKTTTSTVTPQNPGIGGAQMGALLGMILSKLVGGNSTPAVGLDTIMSPGTMPGSGLQGISTPTVAAVPPAVVNPVGTEQLPPEMMAALMQKTPQELMTILAYAKKQVALQQGGLA